ncbi:hypothetical protein [Prevotella falsenii]|uniref:hypothetical protein n=1 Tax=Prevotella falsenii TaxID=515414 RepID=UPI001E2EA5BA|nr:hypothetical protein [Prevotella falsenii]
MLLLKARLEHALAHNAAAIQWYTKVIDTYPFSLPAYTERGELYAEMGKTNEAADDAAKVAELNAET